MRRPACELAPMQGNGLRIHAAAGPALGQGRRCFALSGSVDLRFSRRMSFSSGGDELFVPLYALLALLQLVFGECRSGSELLRAFERNEQRVIAGPRTLQVGVAPRGLGRSG